MITFDNDVSPTKDEVDSYRSDKDNTLQWKTFFLRTTLLCLPVQLSKDNYVNIAALLQR